MSIYFTVLTAPCFPFILLVSSSATLHLQCFHYQQVELWKETKHTDVIKKVTHLPSILPSGTAEVLFSNFCVLPFPLGGADGKSKTEIECCTCVAVVNSHTAETWTYAGALLILCMWYGLQRSVISSWTVSQRKKEHFKSSFQNYAKMGWGLISDNSVHKKLLSNDIKVWSCAINAFTHNSHNSISI